MDGWMDGGVAVTPFSTIFQSYLDDGLGNNERLCAIGLGLQLKKSRFQEVQIKR